MSKPRILLAILASLCLLTSIGIAAYPTVSDFYYSQVHRHTISDYSEEVNNMKDAKAERMLLRAKRYNRELLRSGRQPNQLPDEESEDVYESLLNVYGDGVMGYIRIPKIDVFLPIYHGTDESVLQVGAGHLSSSSLPVGDEGTHCIITGHSGLRSAKLFTDLDQLEINDIFTITVLKEVLTYKIDQIETVLPDEMDSLTIDSDRDYCTLVTCTPYGVNTHRLLVRGHRVPTEKKVEQEVHEEAADEGPEPLIPAAAGAVALSVTAVVVIFIWHRHRKKTKAGR